MKLGRYSHDGQAFVGVVNAQGDIIRLGYGGDTITALKDMANLQTAIAQAAVSVCQCLFDNQSTVCRWCSKPLSAPCWLQSLDVRKSSASVSRPPPPPL